LLGRDRLGKDLKYSEHSDEAKQARLDYINSRWKELNELQREAGRLAGTYLMVTNSGGAVAVLSYMGAMKTTTPSVTAPAMLLAFVLGIVMVGVGRAAAYYRVTKRYGRWRRGVQHFYRDEWTWQELLADDETMGWQFPLGEFLAWASFACFLAGAGLGVTSLV
jgi:hypothetical protein